MTKLYLNDVFFVKYLTVGRIVGWSQPSGTDKIIKAIRGQYLLQTGEIGVMNTRKNRGHIDLMLLLLLLSLLLLKLLVLWLLLLIVIVSRHEEDEDEDGPDAKSTPSQQEK